MFGSSTLVGRSPVPNRSQSQMSLLQSALRATENACSMKVERIRKELQQERQLHESLRQQLQEAKAAGTTVRMQLAGARRRVASSLRELEVMREEKQQLQDDLALEAGRSTKLSEDMKELMSQLQQARQAARRSEAERRQAATKAALLEHQMTHADEWKADVQRGVHKWRLDVRMEAQDRIIALARGLKITEQLLREATTVARTVPFGSLLSPGPTRSHLKDRFDEISGMTKAAQRKLRLSAQKCTTALQQLHVGFPVLVPATLPAYMASERALTHTILQDNAGTEDAPSPPPDGQPGASSKSPNEPSITRKPVLDASIELDVDAAELRFGVESDHAPASQAEPFREDAKISTFNC